MTKQYNYIIIGAGIIGLSLALKLKEKFPRVTVLILDKEEDIAFHASSRNSGVLHAGFYYTADSLKAKFTVQGNRAMKEYCRRKNLPVNECGKLVVAQNEEELQKLYELERRGKANGSRVSLIADAEAEKIEPNVRTYQKALYSPETASVDPKQICHALKEDLKNLDVDFSFNAKYLTHSENTIQTTQGDFAGGYIINAAGLYADTVAHDFGFGKNFTMLPFKGIYLKYTKNKTDIKTNIYPVPNLKNPFLGVHFTKTVYGDIKIGPTAIPAFWRENYAGFDNFNIAELFATVGHEAKLFLTNSFGFRNLAIEEIQKYQKTYFVALAQKMVKTIDPDGFTEFTKPGIRAQLLDKTRSLLVQDFVIEGDKNSVHVLNAVSPAFTCAFPFAEFVISQHVRA
ncbi:MAG: FAD-dependent oxidoreductase [Omnitrophica WOR_2 bacterium GWA2_47_8]|nr:MAG: FAD-dependent oxidoreductase [Omnitrophica WOR_2 bacterium GWA2_47_8]